MDGHFYAIDRKIGQERWKFKMIGQVVFPSPTIAEGLAYFVGDDLYAVR